MEVVWVRNAPVKLEQHDLEEQVQTLQGERRFQQRVELGVKVRRAEELHAKLGEELDEKGVQGARQEPQEEE